MLNRRRGGKKRLSVKKKKKKYRESGEKGRDFSNKVEEISKRKRMKEDLMKEWKTKKIRREKWMTGKQE